MKCPKCKTNPATNALSNCPNCGEKYPERDERKFPFPQGLIWVAVVLPITFILLIFAFSQDAQKRNQVPAYQGQSK